MARINFGLSIASASGKVGGNVFSRNRYGAYMRTKSNPVNPNTPAQAASRQAFRDLSNRFSAILDDAQRGQWDTYAKAVPVRTAKGNFETITANAMYVRCNAARVAAGLAIVDDGPSTLLLPAPCTIGATSMVASTNTLSVGFTNTEAPFAAAEGGLLVYACQPVQATRNFIGAPYRFVMVAEGSSSPPTSPKTSTTYPFTLQAGQKIRLKFRVALADGRLSDFFGEKDVIVG